MPVKIVRNSAGITAYLRSPQVQQHVEGIAHDVATAAEGAAAHHGAPDAAFKASSMIGRSRARASVITDNSQARLASAAENVLIQALSAAR